MELQTSDIIRAKLIIKNNNSLLKEMSYETAILIIDDIYQSATRLNTRPVIDFIGQDCLDCWDSVVKPCIAYIQATYDDFHINLITNGILLDEEKCKYLRNNKVKLILHLNDQEFIYEDNSFKVQFEQKFDIILKYFPLVTVNIIFHRNFCKFLYTAVQYFTNSGFFSLDFDPCLEEDWLEEELNLIKSNLLLIQNYIISEFQSENIPLIFQSLGQCFPKIVVAKYLKDNNEDKNDISIYSIISRPGLGTKGIIYVNTDGTIYTYYNYNLSNPTSQIFQLGIAHDNINEAIIDNLIELNEGTVVCDSEWEDTYINEYATVNYLINNDFNLTIPITVFWNQELCNVAYTILTTLDNEQNELFKDYFYGIVIGGIKIEY